MNILSPTFWSMSFWQGLGVLVSVLGFFISPLLSMFFESVLGKKEDQEHVNAYKAILLPDEGLGFGEFFFFLPVQAGAAYLLTILLYRVFVPDQYDKTTLLLLSFVLVFFITWALAGVRRKSLAQLLTWHLYLAMALFCLLLIGFAWHNAGNAYLVSDFSFVKHQIGQYIPADLRQSPPIAYIRDHLSLKTIPVDISVASLNLARVLFVQVYFATLAICLFFYTLQKRHHANRLTAFVRLSEKRRKEELDKLDYQDRLATLELKALSTKEKERELDLKEEQKQLILSKEQLALQRDALELESVRLDVEKKRAEYTLELAVHLIDTLYGETGSPDERAEILRNTLPAFKDFGSSDMNSTTVVLQVLQNTQPRPKAIPASVV